MLGSRPPGSPALTWRALVIDLDASIVFCHSEKELAAATFRDSFGYHPMLAFCDNTGEFLDVLLQLFSTSHAAQPFTYTFNRAVALAAASLIPIALIRPTKREASPSAPV